VIQDGLAGTGTLAERFGIVIEVSSQVQETGDSDIVVLARGLSSQVQTVQFVACLVIFYRILTFSHGVNKTLQTSEYCPIWNIVSCQYGFSFNYLIFVKMHGLKFGKNFVRLECNRGASGSSVLPTMRKRLTKVDPMPFHYVGTGNSQCTFAKPFDALRVDVFLPVLDRIINEINRRFSVQS
jgi:hypothetical protein